MLIDIPLFAIDLVEMFGVNEFIVEYFPVNDVKRMFVAARITPFHLLSHHVTDLRIALPGAWVDDSAMPRLKHLTIKDGGPFHPMINPFTPWPNLHKSPLESLRIIDVPLHDRLPRLFPDTVRELELSTAAQFTEWALDLGFFYLPNLVELRILQEQYLPVYPIKNSDLESKLSDQSIVSTKLKAITLKDCQFTSAKQKFLARVASSCSELSSILLGLPAYASGYLHLPNPVPMSCLPSIHAVAYIDNTGYWASLMAGFGSNVTHIVFSDIEMRDCKKPDAGFYYHGHDWELTRAAKDSKLRRVSFVRPHDWSEGFRMNHIDHFDWENILNSDPSFNSTELKFWELRRGSEDLPDFNGPVSEPENSEWHSLDETYDDSEGYFTDEQEDEESENEEELSEEGSEWEVDSDGWSDDHSLM